MNVAVAIAAAHATNPKRALRPEAALPEEAMVVRFWPIADIIRLPTENRVAHKKSA